MKGIRTIAYISVALLLVSMLAVGAVSAKAGDGGNKNMFKYDGECPCEGDCPCDGCNDYNHEYDYGYNHDYNYCDSK